MVCRVTIAEAARLILPPGVINSPRQAFSTTHLAATVTNPELGFIERDRLAIILDRGFGAWGL